MATLEAENAELKLHSNKEKVATDTIGVSVDASGARRRLSHTAADGCCRWSADGVCGANVTKASRVAPNPDATLHTPRTATSTTAPPLAAGAPPLPRLVCHPI